MFFLAKDVLQYRDLEDMPHRILCDTPQKFLGGTDYVDEKTGQWMRYAPMKDLWELQGERFRLMLFPRGCFKTTILTMAHTIQWILNYPDVRILISTATGSLAASILSEIKGHFQFNERFFYLFPEFCPARNKVSEFGNQEQFTVANRLRKWLKEPTCSTSSVGKVVAGFHYEVLKFSDLVDKENVKTPNQILDVIDHFKYCDPLLERSPLPPHHGWKDVEGTRYGVGELYGELIREQEKSKEKNWHIRIESADPQDRADGKPFFPSRFPKLELDRILADEGPYQFNSQYRLRPIAESGSLATRDQIICFPRKALAALGLRKHTTVDLAGMEDKKGNDYTVLTTCGFDRDGRVYVLDVRRGHFTPFEVIAHIFDIHLTHQPQDIKIEKDAHARVLLPFLTREMAKKGVYPNIVALPRDTRMSKTSRIRGLQPWFRAVPSVIRFLEDIPALPYVLEEILNYNVDRPDPSIHDDILDTLADQLQNRDGGVEYDVYPGMNMPDIPLRPPWEVNKFLGWNEDGTPTWLLDREPERQTARTGVWR